MDRALKLLESLHHQILHNDSPPFNETLDISDVENKESVEAIVNKSSQKLGNDELATFLYETLSETKGAFILKMQADESQSAVIEQPEGNVCLFTTEELQADTDFVSSLISNSSNDEIPIVGGYSSVSADEFIANCPGNEDGSSTSFLQLCIPPNGHTSVFHSNPVSELHFNTENNCDKIKCNPSSTSRTLKMYGSEYARYLSHTPFSPLHSKSNLGSKTSSNKLQTTSVNKPRKNYSNGRPPIASPKTCNVSSTSSPSPFILEDASPEVIAAPIVDVCVTHGFDLPPPGYFRISKTCTGRSANLSPSSTDETNKIYLNVKKEPNGNWESSVQRPWVSAIAIIFPDRNEFVPPGFCVVKHIVKMGKQVGPANLNEDPMSGSKNASHPQRVYLCYKKSREGNPIVSIMPLLPSESEKIPPGFTVIEKSPRNFTANINEGAGPPIFLSIRQRLSNLETLRPLPLLKFQVDELRKVEKQKRNKMLGYYATGGFVIPCTKIGRLHSMDRMGHHYLSPSSMATRISLAYDSPAKGDFTPTYQNWLKKSSSFFNASSSSVTSESVQTTDNSAVTGRKLKALMSSWSDSDSVIAADFYQSEINHSISQLTQDGLESLSFEGEATSLPTLDTSNSAPSKSLFPPNSFAHSSSDEDVGNWNNIYSSNDEESSYIELMKACHESMNFIPRLKLHSSPSDWASFDDRVLILTPILTACYTFHGGLQLLALDGLNELLSDTDFFKEDVVPSSYISSESEEQLMNNQKHSLLSPEQTLLDLTIQVVCDVATFTSRETYFTSCVKFCTCALQFSVEYGGSTSCLHARSLGFIFRLYLFVSSFGVSLPDNIKKNNRCDCRVPLAAADDEGYYYELSSSFEDAAKTRSLMDPVQVAESAMKEMISLVIEDLGNNCKERSSFIVHDISGIQDENEIHEGSLVSSLITDIVDSAVDKVNISNLMQLISDQVYRGGGSELFWYDMTTSAGLTLFGSVKKCSIKENVCCFALLASLVKAASGNVRHEPQTYQYVPRDVHAKVFAVELLLYFMESFSYLITGKGQGNTFSQVDQILMYSIRRLVVPCVISNALSGDSNQIVFRRCFSIVKKLWESPVYRRKHKVELAVLLDQYVLRILRFGPMVDALPAESHSSVFQQQLAVLTMLKSWLANAPLMLEIFVNYDDEHRSSSLSWKTAAANFELVGQLASLLCAFIEECVKKRNIRTAVSSNTDLSSAVLRSVSEADRVADAARLLLERAVIAFGDLARSLLSATTEMCNSENFVTMIASGADLCNESMDSSTPFRAKRTVKDNAFSKDENVIYSSEPQASASMTIAFDILVQKGIKKAVEYLTACNILTPSARDIASFLRIHQKHIDPSALGDYLGEENICGGNQCDLIRYHYVRVISFVGMKVDEALRQFVTNCGFYLPGEAQRIDRIISTFAQCFWEDNAGDRVNCPFFHEDTVCLLAFSIIMLNTDLHKATGESSAKASRKNRRMSRDEFVNNLKRAIPAEELPKDYIASIYDSIEAAPLILCAPNGSSLLSAAKLAFKESHSLEKHASSGNIELNKVTSKYIKYSLEILRAMSLEESSFAVFGEDFNLSPNLIHRLLNTLWFHFHGTVNALLTSKMPSRAVLAQCLDIVHSIISCSLQLDLKEVWQMAFVRQLAKIFFVLERLDIMSDRIPVDLDNFMRKRQYKNCDWYQELESCIEYNSELNFEDRNHVLIKFDRLVDDWRSQVNLRLDPDASHKLDRVARRIRNGLSLVTIDPSRTFIREGDLMRHLSSGRKKQYRFFLFSDRLMYGHKSSSDEQYVIHSELPLAVMKIDCSLPNVKSGETAFHIFHPIKTFLVSADSVEEKNSWLHDIKRAICKSVEAYSKLGR